MPKSRVTTDYEFNEEEWVVSVLNSGSAIEGHSVLVVEGMDNGHLFVGHYDINAKIITGGKGVITRINCNESDSYLFEYKEFTRKSYRYIPKGKVREMISSIRADAKAVQEAKAGEGPSLRYQLFGKNSTLSNLDDGHNCASWVQEKLSIAGIDHGNKKSKPEVIASSWCIAL